MGRDRVVEVSRRDSAEGVSELLRLLGHHVDADPQNSATIISRDGTHTETIMADAYFVCEALDGAMGVWRAGARADQVSGGLDGDADARTVVAG